MVATVAQLAARALRKVGLAPVAVADRPTEGSAVTVATIAARTLRLLGANPVEQSSMPALSGTHDTTDVAERALLRLNVYAAGETAETADQSYGESAATTVHEELIALNAATWAYNAIPEWAFEHYVTMAAHYLRPGFGLPADPEGYAAARDAVVRVALGGARGQALAAAEVTAAHQTLNSLGLVSWDTSAIPEACSSHYATMAAARLGPVFGRPGDEVAYANAIALVRRFAMSGEQGQDIAAEKVRAANRLLEAKGLTRWTLADLPAYAEEPLVMIAAEMLAPDVGQPPMPGLAASAEAMIRKMIALPSSRSTVAAVYF